MKPEGGQSTSLWVATADVPQYAPLEADTKADVCIVGAGIAGLTTAYLLAREGKSVVVLDDGPVCGGETSRTTAHLSNVIDDGFAEIERLHGEQGLHYAYESHSAAIDRIESIVRDERIDCGFTRLDGYLFVPPGESTDILDDELEAARRAGFATAERLDHAPLPDFDTGPCLCFPRQAQFHVLQYLAALAGAIERLGGCIFTGTHVEEVASQTTDWVSPAYVRTKNGPVVTAGAAVVATNTPINDLTVIHTKQFPYRTYAIGARVPENAIPPGLYWDTADPYHYVRLQSIAGCGTYLIVGGEDHKTGQENDAEERFARLEAWARERFPALQQVEFRWSGQVMEPQDGLGYIGRNPGDAPNIYIATGDSGMGMTHSTISGILLTDLISGRDNPWAALYDPARKSLKAAGEFVKENLNVAARYTDLVTGGEVKSVNEIAPGDGAVVRRGLSKVAAYRDDNGALHECSAVCPHLHCIVHWNSAEKTWDCPCHGSRFDPQGRVLNGPAISDLVPFTEE
jgi:glycine/D-amino acid oxidase-like deaminating enzyme/nitrite reductase/ring-hydroxylating ferredoxin subunit